MALPSWREKVGTGHKRKIVKMNVVKMIRFQEPPGSLLLHYGSDRIIWMAFGMSLSPIILTFCLLSNFGSYDLVHNI